LPELPAPPKGKQGWPWTEEAPQLPDTMPHGQPWPRVSIVTPSYNQGRFIEETIRSVLLQGYPDLEYIIIDGGSTDGAVDIIKRYEKWLTYWLSERDRGQSDAINKGWRMAKGEILAYLNSDDIYTPSAVETGVNYLVAHPDISMVYGDGDFINESGEVTEHCRAQDLDLKRLLCSYDHVPQPTVFFRREVLDAVGYLDEDLHLAMDLDYWIRICSRFRAGRVRETLAVMHLHPDAKFVCRYHEGLGEYLHILGKFYSNPELPADIRGFRRKAYSSVHLRASVDFVSARKRREAVKNLATAVRLHPGCLFDLGTGLHLVRLALGEKAAQGLMKLGRRPGMMRLLRASQLKYFGTDMPE